jgi:hypothetical protein
LNTWFIFQAKNIAQPNLSLPQPPTKIVKQKNQNQKEVVCLLFLLLSSTQTENDNHVGSV